MNPRQITIILTLVCVGSYGQTSKSNLTWDNFTVTANNVGIFKKGMTLKQALSLVPEDQRIKKIAQGEGETYDDYEIYNSKKEPLVIITPESQNNLNSPINTILIKDKRFKTDKNIGLHSVYSDLLRAYHVDKVSADIDVIVLILQDLPISFSINKKYLMENWWNERKRQIDVSKIPATAPLDNFVIRWD